ncbi:MAG: hypothetical protein CUN56_04375 [Phototrophicales bacterium]|nr:MAG: hypothetical protein CUN56_04375 [Phototrophicales bacterium]RMG72162.1 MAG: LysM peptidoglycan-binding domain-containing protein [Chloroflexota bacterium]
MERKRRTSKARERQAIRQRRRGGVRPSQRVTSRVEKQVDGLNWRGMLHQLQLLLADGWWYIRHNPRIGAGAVLLISVALVVYLLSYLITGRIFPNVRAFGVSLAGMSVEEAADRLRIAWQNDTEILLIIDDETRITTTPNSLGLILDAEATAKRAHSVGLGALPFGAEIEPVVTLDYLTAQNYLLDIAEQVNRRPVNGIYQWENGQIIPIEGQAGQMLDTALTLERLTQNAAEIVSAGRFEVLMRPIPPEMRDPEPYLDQVIAITSQPLELRGYDPFTNQYVLWTVEPETVTSWLMAGPSSLILREETFLPYLTLLDESLNPEVQNQRYLAPDDTIEKLNQAFSTNDTTIDLRIFYRPTTYTVVQGDTASRIARKTGIPLYMIQDANTGIDLNLIFPGDVLSIPSPDNVLPEDPIPHKRIVVDLDRQYLVAFENGQPIFQWSISSGVEDAPTSPGIYQILSHRDVAYGSSNTLCDAAGLVCGQWEMSWFMGIYEVSPGLVNGFHGNVILPNGNLLGDGLVGNPYTFGCVMSNDEQARLLYEWAELGTMVEIISSEYPPRSDLGTIAQQIAAAQVGA